MERDEMITYFLATWIWIIAVLVAVIQDTLFKGILIIAQIALLMVITSLVSRR